MKMSAINPVQSMRAAVWHGRNDVEDLRVAGAVALREKDNHLLARSSDLAIEQIERIAELLRLRWQLNASTVGDQGHFAIEKERVARWF